MNELNDVVEEEVDTEEIVNEEVEENLETEGNEEGSEESTEEEIHDDFKDLGEKAKKKAQKRFNKISSEKYRALEEASVSNAKNRELEDRLVKLESKLSGTTTTEATEETPAKPNRDDFDDEDEWIESLTEWKTDQKINKTLKSIETKNKKEQLQKEEKDYNTNVIENFKTKSSEAMKLHDDYLDVTSPDNISIPMNSELGKEILDSTEYGALIMYKLGNDPDLFDKIKTMSGKKLTKEIGKLELELEGSKSKPKKTKKQPPAPANVNRRGTTHSGKVDLNNISPDEYYRLQCAGKI